jgi:hypothetical protein
MTSTAGNNTQGSIPVVPQAVWNTPIGYRPGGPVSIYGTNSNDPLRRSGGNAA